MLVLRGTSALSPFRVAKLLERLPDDAHEQTFCFGDAVAALKLNPEYDWATWISGLLRTRSITIPNPDGD